MKTVRWIGPSVSALMLLVLSTANAQESSRVDHFKVYEVKPVEVQVPVGLRGQFDQVPARVLLTELTHLANPARKDRGEVLNQNAHLTFYRLRQEQREPERTISLRNQFGEQKWGIGQPAYLLAPALKQREGIFFPGGLDHFKCYEVLDGAVEERKVRLVDQFEEDEVEVGRPSLFCVPVEKRFRDSVSRINNHRDHLAFYEIEPSDHEAEVWVQNQFGRAPLAVVKSAMLGVPSVKITPDGDCVRFDELSLGARYIVGSNFIDSGVRVHVRPFQWANGQWTNGGFAQVGNLGSAGGAGQEMWVNNVNLTFDFGGPISGVAMRFGEYGGNLNLMINNDFQNFGNFADINGSTIGGAGVSVVNGFGNDQGSLSITGTSDGFFTVGGQELAIDEVCYQR